MYTNVSVEILIFKYLHVIVTYQSLIMSKRKFVCDFDGCNYSSTNNNLKRHKNVIHLKIKPYSCDQCSSTFGTKGDLTKHVNGIHLKLKPFTCDQCSSTFFTNSKLKLHKNIVHLKLKPYSCNDCDLKFGSNSDLKKHQNRIHLKLKPYSCNDCDLKFCTNFELKSHINSIHLKLKPFECEKCYSKFSTNSELKKHVDGIHLKLKPFECEKCCSKFSTSSNLKTHIIRVHLKLKRFECNFDGCHYRSSSNNDLKIHCDFIHLRLKPYKCIFPGCDYKCSGSGNLKKHKQIHTPEGQIRRKKQEDRVNKLLKKWGYSVDCETTIKAKSNNCLVDTNRYFSRIDFHILNCTNMILLLECDEDQHSWYELSCEFSRMSDIRASLVKSGYTVPIYWIRYNPNGKYHIGEEQVKTLIPERELELKNHLEKICSPDFKPENQVNIHYMYYDLISKETGPEIMMDDDFPNMLKECVSWNT